MPTSARSGTQPRRCSTHAPHAGCALLGHAVEANASDKDYFLRKAIGWALRDLARRDPGWVLTFVDTYDLSPLSRREALKHL